MCWTLARTWSTRAWMLLVMRRLIARYKLEYTPKIARGDSSPLRRRKAIYYPTQPSLKSSEIMPTNGIGSLRALVSGSDRIVDILKRAFDKHYKVSLCWFNWYSHVFFVKGYNIFCCERRERYQSRQKPQFLLNGLSREQEYETVTWEVKVESIIV